MSIDDIIKSRKTQKVLAEQEWDIPSNQEITHKTIHDLLELAAAAPYHKKSHEDYGQKGQLNSCLPWRCYTLDTKNCRKLLKHIESLDIEELIEKRIKIIIIPIVNMQDLLLH